MSDLPDNSAALPISAEERDRLFAPLARWPLALCVSGGADSMALMHLVAEWAAAGNHAGSSSFSRPYRPAGRRDPRPVLMPSVNWLEGIDSRQELEQAGGPAPIVVLTVDHGLRPEAADEAAFVAEEAAKFGFPHQILKADEPPPETGIQEWARNLRHRQILELLDAEAWRLVDLGIASGGRFTRQIVMAHHLDDQAETVLMRLARGSGLRGLGGMSSQQLLRVSPRSNRPYTIEVPVRRPLISTPKSRLMRTLTADEKTWIEDPSNKDGGFERVRIRKALVVLAELGICADKLGLSARRLRDAEQSMHSFETHWERKILHWHHGLLCEIISPVFDSRGTCAAVRLLQYVLRSFGGSARPAELSQVERLRDRLVSVKEPFAGATLGGCRIELDGTFGDGRVVVYREGNGNGLERLPLVAGQSVEWDGGRFRVEASGEAKEVAEVGALGTEGWARVKREVDGLDEMKLKAAAMATLPAIWREDELVSVPFLNELLQRSETPSKVEKSWAEWLGPDARHYTAEFGEIP